MEDKDLYTVKGLTQNPSFIRWVNGEVENEEEAYFWDQWVEKNESNRSIAKQAQQKITGISFAKRSQPDINWEWEQVKQKLNNDDNNEASLKSTAI